jgi:hypothetical protein
MLLVKISMVEWYDLVQKNLDVQKREKEKKRRIRIILYNDCFDFL